jgi:GTP pyrophosphokinase/guanosine-3',5'-bis(diphosphate) 3'-pyrophosphohydrolase
MGGGDGVAAKIPAGPNQAGAGDKPARPRYLRQFELVERVRAYDPSVDESLINRAYVYATAKHGSQKRHSGDPYFAHPIEVAGILTEYKLDAATIVAGLLHDTIEDTDATREEIVAKFGEQIADLVEGVTKLSKLEIQSEENKQAQNLQKFILAMSRDVRVLLVKLADRLHNMCRSPRSASASHWRRWKSTRRSPAVSAWRRWRVSWKAWPSTKHSRKRKLRSWRGLRT